MSPIDLHTHSTKSDGTYTPGELIRYAQEKGLSAIALTDHDTADGIGEAMETAKALKKEAAGSLQADSVESALSVPEVIPGVELSTEYNGKDVHIVGLFIDWQDPGFNQRLREFADARIYRNQKMCRLLTEGGYPVIYEDLERAFPDTVITRAHFAQHLLDKGLISSIDMAFSRLIGDDCPFFVPREKISPQYGVQFLLQYGAVPVLAHPMQYKMDDTALCALVSSLCDFGLAGIEVYYSTHKPDDTAYLSRIADRYGLLPSGGSDCHGSRKKNLDLGTGYGHLYVPDTILPPLRAKAAAVNK